MHEGRLIVTGKSSLVIPLKSKPEYVKAWFSEQCDIGGPKTCVPTCPNDKIEAEVNHIKGKIWGIKIGWEVLDGRTREAFWMAHLHHKHKHEKPVVNVDIDIDIDIDVDIKKG